MRATTVWVLTGLILLVAGAAFAQVDGRIEGTVTAEDGSALPGATVKATSPAMIGERVATSDDQGVFRFLNLPPGLYEVSSVLEGFGTVQSNDVKVGIDQNVRLTFSMKPSFAGEIQVTGEQPAVDVTRRPPACRCRRKTSASYRCRATSTRWPRSPPAPRATPSAPRSTDRPAPRTPTTSKA